MATLKQRLHRKNADGGYDVVHLETSASVVMRADGSTSVEQSLTEIESWDLLKYEEAGDYAGMPYMEIDASTLEGHPASDFVLVANANFAPSIHNHTKSQITDFPTTMTPSAHNHAASDITSGILPVARGGTGATDLAALATALGAAKIQTGYYVGTGTYGSSNPNSLTFNFAPKVVWIISANASATHSGAYTMQFDMPVMFSNCLTTSYVKGVGFGKPSYSTAYGKKSSDGKTFYWYNDNDSGGVDGQLNNLNYAYDWIALG